MKGVKLEGIQLPRAGNAKRMKVGTHGSLKETEEEEEEEERRGGVFWVKSVGNWEDTHTHTHLNRMWCGEHTHT